MLNEHAAVLAAPTFIRITLRDGRKTLIACPSRRAAEAYVHLIPWRQQYPTPNDPTDRFIQTIAAACIVPSLLAMG